MKKYPHKKSFAVIGLGQFGHAIVEELVNNDVDVIAIDKDEEAVNKTARLLKTVFVADSTDQQALEELGVKDVDAAIVAFSKNTAASVITTVILKELGIKHIIVRCDDDYYNPILKKLGASEVISPQKAAAIALANRVGNVDFKDFYKLDNKYSVVSLIVKPDFVPITLIKLNSKIKYGINIVLISRNNKSFVPGGNDYILPNDNIFIVGTNKDIQNFRSDINDSK